MVIVGPYPDESSFIPEHIIIPSITLLIFVIVLYVLARRRSIEEKKKKFTVEIISSSMKGVAPTFDFEAHVAGGTEPYTYSWNFGDGSEESNEETVSHTFEQAGTYSIGLTVTDSAGQTASDSILITVKKTPGKEKLVPFMQKGIQGFTETTSDLSRKYEKRKVPWATSDKISLFALVGTVMGTFLVSSSQLSILDYTVTASQTDPQKFEIAIRNFGTTTAENVIVSMEAENVNFSLPFTSRPFLANHLVYNESAHLGQIGKAVIEIEDLPPASHMTITGELSKISDGKSEPKLITHVRSDNAVAYHQLPYLILFYGLLVGAYTFPALTYFTAVIVHPLTKEKKINYRRIAIIAILISAGIAAANLLLYLPYVESDSVLYRAYYYSGILVVPLGILAIIAVYPSSRNVSLKRSYWAAAILVGSAIIAANMLLYLPYVESDSVLYRAYYYSGILVFPLTIIALVEIYREFYKEYWFLATIIAGLTAAGLLTASLLFYIPPVDTDSIFYPFYFWVGILIIPITICVIIVRLGKGMEAMLMIIGIVAIIFILSLVLY